MRTGAHAQVSRSRGSTFVVVLWIAFGLVSLALYFANAMSLEFRAADNRACGLAAEEAIDGAARYVAAVLSTRPTNGIAPDPSTYLCEAVPVGEAHFWLIGRDPQPVGGVTRPVFSLVDEASRINLNSATTNMLEYLPRMTADLTEAILEWRDTNGGSGSFASYYALNNPPYQNKSAPFETVDELRLLYGADAYTLVGEDANFNGILDPNEADDNRDSIADPGTLDSVTIYSREPNTYSNGTARVSLKNVTVTGDLPNLLQSLLGTARTEEILTRLGLGATSPRGGPGGGGAVTVSFTSPLHFYRASGMTADEFARVFRTVTVASGGVIEGRVNVNSASAAVLACLPGLCDYPDLAQTLVSYREQNPDRLGSIAWVVDALGQSNSQVLDALQARDCITTDSYQFTADIAAIGPFGRGYRRVKMVFDTLDGAPKIVYRQDLTRLGWALGSEIRQTWVDGASRQGATASLHSRNVL